MFGQLALGDTVAVRASPRTGQLLSLVPLRDGTDNGAAAPGQPPRDLMAARDLFRVTPGPPGPLLTAEEVTAAVGRPVRATGFQAGILEGVYRGEALTVSLTVATGALGGLSSGPARRWGRPVPGIGDEAGLINRHHTVVFRVGNHTGKITVSGAAARALPPDVLRRPIAGNAGVAAGRPGPPRGSRPSFPSHASSFAICLPFVHRGCVLVDGPPWPCPAAVENATARWEMETLTVDMLAIAAVAAWLLVFGGCSVLTSRPSLRAGAVDPGPGLASASPALVNLAVTRCRLNGAAYPATILDLAAGGYLTIYERVPGQLWCDVPTSCPPGTGLARSERLVLAGARALAGGRGAPFEALAESCAGDVRGRWDPFERAVRAEGRRAGITRPRLPAAARLLLYAGAGVVAAAAFAAVYGRARSGLWVPTAAAFVVLAVLAYWARSLGRQDRLTAQGAALGAWAARDAGDMAAAGKMAATDGTPGQPPAPASARLSRLALAVAAGALVQVPGVCPALATGVRPGRGRTGAGTGNSGQATGTLRPSMAWSSFGGHWRLVRVRPASFTRVHPAFWLVLAAWLALMAYASALLPDPAGLLVPAGLAAGAAAATVGGARGLAARMARPAEASFQAQVIARWVEHTGTNDDNGISCIAVDDGERSWSFDVSGEAFAQLALGDTVAVRASPRSGKLLGLTPDQARAVSATGPGQAGVAATDEGPPAGSLPAATTAGEPIAVTGQPGAVGSEPGAAAVGDEAGAVPPSAGRAQHDGGPGAPPPGVLVSADEVSAAVGRPVRGSSFTPRAASVVYRGEGITVIVTVAEGFLGSLTALARRRGQPLAGVGDEAWLFNRDRTAVLLAGGLTAKITAGGSATRSLPPGALARLAATVAGRLPSHATLPGRRA